MQPIVTPAQLGLTPSSNLGSTSSSNASTPVPSAVPGTSGYGTTSTPPIVGGLSNSQSQQQQQQQQQMVSQSQQHQQGQQQQQNLGQMSNTGPSGMPSPADLSLMLSLGLGLNPADANQLANLDIQKLAQILVSIIYLDCCNIISFCRYGTVVCKNTK